MPTFKIYRNVITALLLFLAPILIPYLFDLGRIQSTVGFFKSGFGFLWLGIILAIISLVFVFKSFRESRAKVFSVIIGLCDVVLIGWFLLMMLVARAWSLG